LDYRQILHGDDNGDDDPGEKLMISKQFGSAPLFYMLGSFYAALLVFSRLPIAHAQNRSDWQQRWDQTLKAANKDARRVVWSTRKLIRQSTPKVLTKHSPTLSSSIPASTEARLNPEIAPY
jgi:hypothetical protein